MVVGWVGDILSEHDGEGVIDRARDRVRVEPPVPALQALDCPYLPLSRRMEPRQPVNCLDAGEGVEVVLHALEVLEGVGDGQRVHDRPSSARAAQRRAARLVFHSSSAFASASASSGKR